VTVARAVAGVAAAVALTVVGTVEWLDLGRYEPEECPHVTAAADGEGRSACEEPGEPTTTLEVFWKPGDPGSVSLRG
jgi:hypothetical protein